MSYSNKWIDYVHYDLGGLFFTSKRNNEFYIAVWDVATERYHTDLIWINIFHVSILSWKKIEIIICQNKKFDK